AGAGGAAAPLGATRYRRQHSVPCASPGAMDSEYSLLAPGADAIAPFTAPAAPEPRQTAAPSCAPAAAQPQPPPLDWQLCVPFAAEVPCLDPLALGGQAASPAALEALRPSDPEALLRQTTCQAYMLALAHLYNMARSALLQLAAGAAAAAARDLQQQQQQQG
ncbi:hypothetical protein Agub_g8111, partial [Astrephomene gubernaculifera]